MLGSWFFPSNSFENYVMFISNFHDFQDILPFLIWIIPLLTNVLYGCVILKGLYHFADKHYDTFLLGYCLDFKWALNLSTLEQIWQ